MSVARDPGLQAERTALSWTRTALVLVVNGLLAVRSGVVLAQPEFVIVGVVLAAAAGAAILFGVQRRRQLDARADAPVSLVPVLVAVAVTLLACVAGIASVLAVG